MPNLLPLGDGPCAAPTPLSCQHGIHLRRQDAGFLFWPRYDVPEDGNYWECPDCGKLWLRTPGVDAPIDDDGA